MEPQAESGRIAAAISDALSLLHIRYYGKGPSQVTTLLQDGYVVCIIEDPYTPVEKTLIEVGNRRDVRDRRQNFEEATAVKFKHAVEEIIGRKVVAFAGQTHVSPDLAIEIFKLEDPEDESPPDTG